MKKASHGLIDFHAHILPDADHGSSSVETSLFQLKQAWIHGVERIVATPHFYPQSHNIEAFIERRNLANKSLLPYINEELPDIRLGAEVLICNGIENMPEIEKLFVQDTNTLLLELPFSDFQPDYVRSVGILCSRGINVVLAHAERYRPEHIEELIQCGAKIQLNAHALAKIIKNKVLYGWIDRGLVVALGSDIHQRDRRAYVDFERAIRKLDERVDYIKAESDRIWNSTKQLIKK